MYPHIPTMTRATLSIDTIGQACRAVMVPLARLLHEEQTRDSNRDDLYLVESLLHTLPLASDLFSVYQNRVRNARRYIEAREIGAARYELQLLAGSLRGWLADQAGVEPRRGMYRSENGSES